MSSRVSLLIATLLFSVLAGGAQQVGQPDLKIEPANRTLTVSADGEVSVEPEIAILHVGFETQLGDAQSVYSDGSRTSNAITAALKQAGIPEGSIRSETQHLDRDYDKPHKFKLVQQWSVRAPAAKAAEILDVAITAGATSSGDIEWTVNDEKGLEQQALDKAAARVKESAAVLAKGMGVRLGNLIYVSNQLMGGPRPLYAAANARSLSKDANAPQPLSIEPHKVSRSASVYAVYSIE
jgi:uncharacterized protein YggE